MCVCAFIHLPRDFGCWREEPAPLAITCDGAEGGGPAAVCRSRFQGGRGGEVGGTTAVCPRSHVPGGRGLSAPSQSGLCCDPLGFAQRASCIGRDEEWFFKVSRAAFAQRRKTAAIPFPQPWGCPKPQVEDALEAAGAREKRPGGAAVLGAAGRPVQLPVGLST